MYPILLHHKKKDVEYGDLIGNSVYINANNSEHVFCLTLAYVF